MPRTKRSTWLLLSLVSCLLSPGCEGLQRKFTRKSKRPQTPPTPIIQFQDYTKAMTPLDRYRKHYMMFDYWNSELADALRSATPNSKRLKRASADSLAELITLQTLLNDGTAQRLAPLIEERTAMDLELQRGLAPGGRAQMIGRTVEAHERQLHRDFFLAGRAGRPEDPVSPCASRWRRTSHS